MVGNRIRPVAWAAGTLALLAGCGPEIFEFDIQPRRACAGDTVYITWKVRGTPQLLAARRTEDSVDFIKYTIVVESRGRTDSSALEVMTITPSVPLTLVAGATVLGKDSVSARDSLAAATWHSLVQVGDVGSDSGRALRVRHLGREDVIGPGREPSRAWRGQPVGGAWEIASALGPREIPGNPKRPPPSQLSVRVGLQCAGPPVSAP